MTEIKLTKRYPHSRTEDITDAFMRGYEQGKKDGLKVGKQIVLGAFETYITADRKTEPQTDYKMPYEDCEDCETHLKAQMQARKTEPQIEPNLILPERMERGERFEVGETIVVMNRDDYYDLLCKSWKDESHTDTHDEAIKAMATLIKAKDEPQTEDFQDWKDRMWAEAVIEPQIERSE